MSYTDNETYRCIHFAVMAIESGASKSTLKPSTGFLEKSKLAS